MLTKTSNNKVNTTVAVAHMNSIQKQTSPIIAKDRIFSDAPSHWSCDLDSYAAWVDSRSADRSGGSIQESDGRHMGRTTNRACMNSDQRTRTQAVLPARDKLLWRSRALNCHPIFYTIYTSTLSLSDRSMKRVVAVYTITRTRTCISSGYGWVIEFKRS